MARNFDIVTGMVAGLATITPASGFVGPVGALFIGLSAGIVCHFAVEWVKQKIQIDDSLDKLIRSDQVKKYD